MFKPFEWISKFSEEGAQWSPLATEEIQRLHEHDHLSELVFRSKNYGVHYAGHYTNC
jgi:hypothetical protein